jgi:hypothetical protein
MKDLLEYIMYRFGWVRRDYCKRITTYEARAFERGVQRGKEMILFIYLSEQCPDERLQQLINDARNGKDIGELIEAHRRLV